MPKSPQKAKHEHHNYNLAFRIPGWFKNQLLDHCNKKQINLTQFAITALQTALREDKGLPPAPQAKHPLPTTADEIRSWLSGEKLVMPCGRTEECAGVDPDRLAGMDFCSECGIRVR
jgi:hypothetical protein